MSTPTSAPTPNSGMPTRQVFGLAAVCLIVGLVIGYVFLGKGASTAVQSPASANRSPAGAMGNHPKLTLEQMKQMSDVQASALLEKLKTDPQNAQILTQVAGIYQTTHRFKEAADYYGRALKIDPKNTPARSQMASCLYYSGDPDGALVQLNQVLKSNPKDVNALFNLGMIRYRGKNDKTGAIAAW